MVVFPFYSVHLGHWKCVEHAVSSSGEGRWKDFESARKIDFITGRYRWGVNAGRCRYRYHGFSKLPTVQLRLRITFLNPVCL